MEFYSSRQVFEKYPLTKFHENPSSEGGSFYADGQTDRHDEASNRFLLAKATQNGRSRDGK